MTHFDLAVIGSGSGNSLITAELAGWRTAVIEEGTFGGTCLNVGCIPTKMYVYAADVADTVRHAARYGIDATLDDVRWAAVRDRIFGRIDPISASGREYRAHGPNTKLFATHAEFTDPHTLHLSSGEKLTADRIVIAAGSRPIVPAVVSASGVPFHTSDTIMRIEELPRRLAILGGGYVAAEFAHIFGAFGVEVTVLARSRSLLRHLDGEISRRFTELAKQRWDVRLEAQVTGIDGDDRRVRLEFAEGSAVDAEALLVATGRLPNSDRLALDQAGVDVHDDARVVVDGFQRTTADCVWALGDVCSPYQLKHVSNHEAKVVAHNLAYPDDPVRADHRFVPAAVFTHPQIATVGLTEEQAVDRGIPFVSTTEEYGDTAYGWAMEDTTGVCKLLADPSTGRLLGAHLMGPQASSLIQPLIQAMSLGQRVRELANSQYWIHPAMIEVVENALLNLCVD
ncbi:MAG: mycothione reductase [Actinomycetota bacterium]